MKLKKIDYQDQNSSIKDLVKKIENGFKLQNLSPFQIEELDELEKIDLVDSIILQPDYQREYRYSISDESLLIESVLISIPIPAIFLANDRYHGIQVLNVVDGQHRLTAFYRFIKGKFALQDLKLLQELNKKNFSQLHIDVKSKLMTDTLQQIIFKEFPGRDIELEIFNRYNKGTKPLTAQEIRNAIYGSKVKSLVNLFCKSIYKKEALQLTKSITFINGRVETFNTVYNMTEDRFLKKKIHESIFVILSILEHGIQNENKKSPEYAESYMKEKSDLEDKIKNLEKLIDEEDDISQKLIYKNQKTESEEAINKNYDLIVKRFEIFNEFIIKLAEKIKYPFSREIYGISSRNYKFQISIAMIIAGIVNKFIVAKKDLLQLREVDYIANYLESELLKSYLEDPNYNASSTNVKEMADLINKIDLQELFY